ncbi:Mur ligase family protein [Candidatus Pelagibacter sp.]|nr:Mur ligase family protein [Candidatus Pelagibacter sp.]MDA9663404.1 Mur ligase family protein [Candidatus Pelagibacter sp.]
MKLQKIIKRLQKLHPKEIDLSLDRTKNLCQKLGNPQNQINCISIIGTNGKYSTIQALYAILKEAKYKCNIYTSPHIQKINERFIYNNEPLSESELSNLLIKIEEINNGDQITFFEILTVAYFYYAKKYPNNINLIESGLFHRFDATNIVNKNLASVVTAIGLDHLDWLPKNEKTIDKIIYEKTSSLLNSKIIVAKQSSKEIDSCIKNTIKSNYSKKIFFNKDYNFTIKENDFFYFEDEFGGIKLPKPNLLGDFQLENVSTAIATLRQLIDYKMTDENIKNGITKINNVARLQEIKSGKLKNLVKNNKLFISGDHNPLGSKVLNEYLQSLHCRKHIILGMMANKDHDNFIKYFKDIHTIITVDIPNQANAISGRKLKAKIKNLDNVQNKNSIEDALTSINIQHNDIVLITGSLYLAGEVLNLN